MTSAAVSSPPLLRMRGISKRFPGVQALERVDLELKAGEVHALIGENGAGKSTLMKILAGVHEADSGQIEIEGRPVRLRTPGEAEAAGVAIIHQELSLFPELSVAENLFLGREPAGLLGWLDRRAMRRRARELLARLGLDVAPETRLGELSLGLRQEIEILGALSLEARILVMDEPTSALSETEVERLFRVVRRLAQAGTGIVYITHRMDEVFQLCTRATVLRDGKWVGSAPVSTLDRARIIAMMVGREASEWFRHPAHAPGREVLRVENASLSNPGKGRRRLVEDVSFQVRAGEVVGLAGLLGAGRTELLEGLFGARGADFQGRVFVEGRVVRLDSPAAALAAGLALVSEDRARLGLFANLDTGANLTIASLQGLCRAGILCLSRERRAARDCMTAWDVRAPGPGTPVTALSGGNQQKCLLGRGMSTAPRVLMLDEPTRGVDVNAKVEIYRRIDELARGGLGVLVVSSELPELLALSDRVLVLCEGRLTASLEKEAATPEAVMAAAAPGGKG